MKIALRSFILLSLVAIYPFIANASGPALLFSDLVNGPRTGLTDDKVTNQGAIITIWGRYLGSSQGNSKVFIGTSLIFLGDLF